MPAVTGIISKVFHKEIEEDDYGNLYRSAVKLQDDDNWYGLGGGKKPSANVKVGKDYYELREGDEVTIIYTVNGKYRNAKRSKITLESEPQKGESPSRSGGGQSGGGKSSAGSGNRASGGGGSGLAGIKVGHALNNAVQLSIAVGQDIGDPAVIREHAETILRLSVELEADYETIISGDSPSPVADNAKTTPAKKRKPAQKAEPEPEDHDDDLDADDLPF